MQYTKNYHLPQWVKSDRIMMDDFNRMCADLENGLTSNRTEFRQKDSELSGRIEQVAGNARTELQAADIASQTALKAGLLHLAYNHCHLLAGVKPQPPQLGCFFQSLRGPAAPSAINGFLERGDALWLARGTTAYTSDDFRARLQQVSQMQVVKNNAAANTPLVVRFTPPGSGCITSFPVITQFRDLACTATVFHVALYNENTGEYEAETDFTQDLSSNFSYRVGFDQIKARLCFSGGFSYRIEISTQDDRYSGTTDYNDDTGLFKTESLTADTIGTLSRTVQCGEARTDGIVLVQYRLIGTGGTLSLAWDGTSLSPTRLRNITIDGKAMTEAEFRKNAAVPAASAVQLSARCNAGGEVTLYSWGMAAV